MVQDKHKYQKQNDDVKNYNNMYGEHTEKNNVIQFKILNMLGGLARPKTGKGREPSRAGDDKMSKSNTE